MKKPSLIVILSIVFILNGMAHPGVGIVNDSQGNVYYTDLIHVWKIDREGKRTIAVHNVHTHELFMDADDNLYGEHEWYNGEAADTWGNYVWKLSSDGEFSKIIQDVEGFLENTTLIRDQKGNSYWAKRQDGKDYLQQQNRNGQNSLFSSHAFEDIRWMHYSPYDNHLYVVDMLQILRVSLSGKVTVLVRSLKDNSSPFLNLPDRHYVFGLTTDSRMNLYVAVFGARKVICVQPDGTLSTIFHSEEGWSPSGILVTEEGTQWIMECSAQNEIRIRQIRPDGSWQLFGH